MTKQKQWTVNDIKEANRKAGGKWFNPETMRFFGTKVLPEVYQGPGGIYFVTKDKDYKGDKFYTVRSFDPEDGEVHTVGGVAAHGKAAAVKIAKREAIKAPLTGMLVPPEEGGIPYKLRGLQVTSEEFVPVTTLEQFLKDCREHGNPEGTSGDAADLIRMHARYHRMAEEECNTSGVIYGAGDNGEELQPAAEKLRTKIAETANRLGAREIIFNGDPRGCVVKLVWPGGETNDFGREGWCVPTEVK